jgi:hypothetical protein
MGPYEVNFSTPADCVSPQSPRSTSHVYTSHLFEPYHDESSLHPLVDHGISGESTTQPRPWSEVGEEFPDEDMLLEYGNVVPKVCFGVVSLLNSSRRTGTNAYSLI